MTALSRRGGPEQSGLLLQAGGKLYLAANTDMADGWHHVALCREPGRGDTVYRVYLDGKLALRVGVPPESRRPSPADLVIGCPPSLPASNVIQTDMCCR